MPHFSNNFSYFSKFYAIILCVFLMTAMLVLQTVFVWLFGRLFGLDLFLASNDGLTVGLSVLATALSLVVLIYVIIHHKTGRALAFLGMKRMPWRRFGWCVGWLGLYLVVSETISHALNRNPVDFMDSLMMGDGQAMVVVATVVVAPIYEEIVFRGAIFESVRHAWQNNRHAILIASMVSSTLFAIAHLQYEWIEIVMVFGLGLIFCAAKLRCRSLIAPMLLHFINNGLAMVVYWFG